MVTKCEVRTAHAFVPASVLNALRREVLERLTDAIFDSRAPVYAEERPDDPCVLPSGAVSNVVIVHRVEQVEDLPENALLVWEPEDWRPEALEKGLATFPNEIWLQLPTVCEEGTLQLIASFVKQHKDKVSGVVLGSVGQLGIDWSVPFAAGSGIDSGNRRQSII